MKLTQTLLNAANFARSAATATNSRMSEAQARRVLLNIKQAQAELTEAKGMALEEIRLGKGRDAFDASERRATADSWLRLASEIAS